MELKYDRDLVIQWVDDAQQEMKQHKNNKYTQLWSEFQQEIKSTFLLKLRYSLAGEVDYQDFIEYKVPVLGTLDQTYKNTKAFKDLVKFDRQWDKDWYLLREWATVLNDREYKDMASSSIVSVSTQNLKLLKKYRR